MTSQQNMQNNLCMGAFLFIIIMAFFIGVLVISAVITLLPMIIAMPSVLIIVLGGGGLWMWLMDWLIDNLPFIDDPNRFDPCREEGD